MLGPGDLQSFVPRTEDGCGWVRVPGLGSVETTFITAAFLPLWPVQSMVVIRTKDGEMTRTVPLVWHSVVVAYARRWIGLFVPFTLLGIGLLISRGEAEPVYVGSGLAIVLAFVATFWPLGSLRHADAKTVAAAVDIPPHRIEHAYGRISASERDAAERRWQDERTRQEMEARASYEEGLAAQREKKARAARDRADKKKVRARASTAPDASLMRGGVNKTKF